MENNTHQNLIPLLSASALDCEVCASTYLMEHDITVLADCADICRKTVELLEQEACVNPATLVSCIDICTACASVCTLHMDLDLYARCAVSCLACAKECSEVFMMYTGNIVSA